jgi:nucleotide-binding universal stress UspA family protein
MRVRSILCGVDFSSVSRQALRVAFDVARAHRSRLTVLFSDDSMLVAAAKAAGDSRGTTASATAALTRFISRCLRIKRLPRDISAIVTAGMPADEILKAARREHAALIVLGMRGAGNLARMLLGSTAERVLRHARVPVLAVPPRRPS